MFSAAIIAALVVLILAILYSAIRILREYERGVVFTLGRYTGTKGPGLAAGPHPAFLFTRRRRTPGCA